MSLFKKFANFCRNSNERADNNNYGSRSSSSSSQNQSGWRWEACSTCYYLREPDSLEMVYYPSCHYCEKQRTYISDSIIGKRKCDKYLEE